MIGRNSRRVAAAAVVACGVLVLALAGG